MSFKPPFFAVFTWILFLASQTLPAATLQGRVLDPAKLPIEGATVTIRDRESSLQWRVVTASSGRFELAGLQLGNYLVTVQAAGFSVKTLALEVGREFQETEPIILSVAGVDEVVSVIASGRPQQAGEVAKAISLITNEELSKRNEYTLSEALRTIPGFRIQQLGGPAAFTTIQVRGLRNEDTALLIDGVRLRDAGTIAGDATPFLQDLFLVSTEQVEVLRGSGASLYGTNAIGGVINVLSTRGGGPFHGEVGGAGSGLGIGRGHVRVAGGAAEDRFNYSAGVSHFNQTQGLDAHDHARNTSGQFRVAYRFDSRISLTGRVLTADSFSQLNDSPFALSDNLPSEPLIEAIPLSREQQTALELGGVIEAPRNANFVSNLDDPDNRRSSEFFTGLLKFEHALNPMFSYSAHYNFVQTERLFEDGPEGARFEPATAVSNLLEGRIHTLHGRFDLRPVSFYQLSAGYEFETERSRGRDQSPTLDLRNQAEQSSHSFFIQNQFNLMANRLQLAVAGRLQQFSLKAPQIEDPQSPFGDLSNLSSPPTAYTGDVSLSYQLANGTTKLRAHAGNGYRVPSLFNRFGSTFFFGSFSYFGDPRLRPERSIAFDAGLDQWLMQGRIRVGATLFYTRLLEIIDFDFSGAISPDTDPFGRFGGYLNRDGGLAKGLELDMEGQWARLRVLGSYTFTNSTDPLPSLQNSNRSLGIPRHQFTAALFYQIHPRLEAVLDIHAISNYLAQFSGADRPFRFEGPRKVDLGLNYRHPLNDRQALRLHVKTTNLFDQHYFENGFRTPGFLLEAGLGLLF